jgi:hypothetical protein
MIRAILTGPALIERLEDRMIMVEQMRFVPVAKRVRERATGGWELEDHCPDAPAAGPRTE